MFPVSQAFQNALISPVHRSVVRAQVLDTNLNPVAGGTFYNSGVPSERFIQNYIIDGTVDVDVTRETRRTFSISLVNKDGVFGPNTSWSGLFYVNRLVRIERGIDFGDHVEYCTVGTFYIDSADVIVDRGMSTIVLSGSDGWKALSKATTGNIYNFASTAGVAATVKTLALLAGIPASRMNLSDLADQPTSVKTLGTAYSLRQDEPIGGFFKTIADSKGIDIYFDVNGTLTLQDFRDPADAASVWTFDSSQNGTLLSLRAAYNDQDLYNHVVVVGTNSNRTTNDNVYYEIEDNNAASPTSIAKIGRRTNVYQSAAIADTAAAKKAATKLFLKAGFTTEDIEMETICNPSLMENDCVTIKESDFSKISNKYRIRSISIPLATSKQVIKVQRVFDIG
jgi:hypothetical protein